MKREAVLTRPLHIVMVFQQGLITISHKPLTPLVWSLSFPPLGFCRGSVCYITFGSVASFISFGPFLHLKHAPSEKQTPSFFHMIVTRVQLCRLTSVWEFFKALARVYWHSCSTACVWKRWRPENLGCFLACGRFLITQNKIKSCLLCLFLGSKLVISRPASSLRETNDSRTTV